MLELWHCLLAKVEWWIGCESMLESTLDVLTHPTSKQIKAGSVDD